jgi:hypothetical protein
VTFWDASAVVPLLCSQPATRRAWRIFERDPDVAAWAWTIVECTSAIRRLVREKALDAKSASEAQRRLGDLRVAWTEETDLKAVCDRAVRCLRVHTLRAADAGQLAAALVLSDRLARPLPVATFDVRLGEAAAKEGLPVVGL